MAQFYSGAAVATRAERTKSEYATIPGMPARLCTVTLHDPGGIRHTVEVSAESLFEAAALGLAAMKREDWVDGPGRAAVLEVSVLEPVVKHTVSVQQVLRWLDGVTKSPNDLLKKEKLKALLR